MSCLHSFFFVHFCQYSRYNIFNLLSYVSYASACMFLSKQFVEAHRERSYPLHQLVCTYVHNTTYIRVTSLEHLNLQSLVVNTV